MPPAPTTSDSPGPPSRLKSGCNTVPAARYRELLKKDISFPDWLYRGDYIIDIAKEVILKYGERYLENGEFSLVRESLVERDRLLRNAPHLVRPLPTTIPIDRFASGLANAPGMGGLPIAAFFAAQPIQATVFRATLIAYFPLLDLYSAPLYWYAGLVSWDTLWASLIALPLTFLGNWMGSRHFLNTDPQDFRRFAIVLLAMLATLGLGKALI